MSDIPDNLQENKELILAENDHSVKIGIQFLIISSTGVWINWTHWSL